MEAKILFNGLPAQLKQAVEKIAADSPGRQATPKKSDNRQLKIKSTLNYIYLSSEFAPIRIKSII